MGDCYDYWHRAAPRLVKLQPAPSDWTIGNIEIGNRCGFCGRAFDIRTGHTCARAAISPGGETFLTTVEPPVAYPVNRTDQGPPVTRPDPSWHITNPDSSRHVPRITRTLAEGPGNADQKRPSRSSMPTTTRSLTGLPMRPSATRKLPVCSRQSRSQTRMTRRIRRSRHWTTCRADSRSCSCSFANSSDA